MGRARLGAACLALAAAWQAAWGLSAETGLKNPGFEQLNDSGDFPAGWGKHSINKSVTLLVTDPEATHGGLVALSIAQPGDVSPRQMATVGSHRMTPVGNRRYSVSVWAKGKGRLGVNTYIYGANTYLKSDAPFFKWFDVDTTEWKRFEASFSVPENGMAPAREERLAVDEFEILLNVFGGPVLVDDVELLADGQTPAAAPEGFFDPERSPLITFPRLAAAPAIDGDLSDGEWAGASATTGFKTLGGDFAPEPVIVYAGFDEENLYVAFDIKQASLLLRPGPEGRDIAFGANMEGFEIWLHPPEGVFQFIGVPSGGMATGSPDSRRHGWGKNVRYATRVHESKEMAGGILTLGDKRWTGEIAIPFADLGRKAPVDGEEWRVNFCRNYSSDGQRQSSDWTTWSPLEVSFGETAKFGYGRFDRKAKPFQLLGVGEPASGALALAGAGDAGIQVQRMVALARSGKTVLLATDATPSAGAFEFSDAVRVQAQGVTPMTLSITARDAAGAAMAQNQIPFSLMPALWIKPRILFSKGVLIVDVDASRSPLPAGATADVTVLPAEGHEPVASASRAVDAGAPKFSVELDLEKIVPGAYRLRGALKDAAGREIAAAAEPLVSPERPEWLDNRLGREEWAPPPFTAVSVNGNRVGVVLREYEIGGNGLPARVVARGRDIMAGPVELRAVVDGNPVKWTFAAPRLEKHSDREATFAFAGASDVLDVAGAVTVEFDGFAVWNATVTPKKPVTVDELALVAPLKKELALFARGDGFVAGSLLQDEHTRAPGREDRIKLGNADTEWGAWEYCRTGWIWTDRFFNEVWLGDNETGFSLSAESAEPVKGKRYADMVPAGNAVELTVRLVSESYRLEKAQTYTYCYQTWPLRPEPADPKMWHHGFDPGSAFNHAMPHYHTEEAVAFLREIAVGQAYYDLAHDGYPRWAAGREKEAREGIAYFHSFGMKLAHNFWWAAIADSLPEYKQFGAEWDALPKFGWSTPMSRLAGACLASDFQQFHIWCVNGILNDLGYGGVYTDATAVPCSNALHGCGYTDADGQRKANLNLLATRDFVKRMYTLLKADGKDRFNFTHSGEGAATGAFSDVRTHGEEICWEGADHYRRITPDYFRAKYAQTEYGAPYGFYPVFYYHWRAVGEPISIEEIMMMCLAHRVQPALAYNQPEMLPLWRLFDPWWTTSEFIPYWREARPVVSDDPVNVTASTFLKREEKKALVVLSNWKYEPVEAGIAVDAAKLGFTPTKTTLIEVSAEKRTPADAARPKAAIPARRYRAILLE